MKQLLVSLFPKPGRWRRPSSVAAIVLACCLFPAASQVETEPQRRQTAEIDQLALVIEGRSYPVAAKAAALVRRAEMYSRRGTYDKCRQDCNTVLEIEDDVYYMNPEDLKDIRAAKRKARELLDQLGRAGR